MFASSPHLARRVRLPTCSDTPSRAQYNVSRNILLPCIMYVGILSCPVECASEYYCAQYNVRRNIIVPSTMCVRIYSHTYKRTTMYTLYYTSMPSHSFSSLSCPVTLGHISCDFSSVWTQSRSSYTYIHKLKAYLKLFNFIFFTEDKHQNQTIVLVNPSSALPALSYASSHVFQLQSKIGIIQARLFIGI